MLSTPVSGVATRNATVAPGVAPCLRSPSAVGRTPQEHKGIGAPTTDPQSTDLIFPVPTSRVSSQPGTRIPSIPASRKPKRRKTEASSRISQVCRRTPNRKLIIMVPSSELPGADGPVPTAQCPIPKFASHRGALSCELRNQTGTSNFMILVRLLDLEFLHELAAQLIGTAKSAALAPRRRLAQTPPATRVRYRGRYFLFNAQATENCGSTT